MRPGVRQWLQIKIQRRLFDYHFLSAPLAGHFMSFEERKVFGSVTVLINEYSFQAKLSFEDFFANHSLVGELSELLSFSFKAHEASLEIQDHHWRIRQEIKYLIKEINEQIKWYQKEILFRKSFLCCKEHQIFSVLVTFLSILWAIT